MGSITFATLAHSVVHTVQLALNRGDDLTLSRFNLTRQQAETLVNLTTSEISQLADCQLFNLTLNTDRLSHRINLIKSKAAEDQLINDLITGGANHTFITRFFAITTHEMAARRKALGIDFPGGRETIPDDFTVQRIHQHWSTLKPSVSCSPTDLAKAVLNTAQSLNVKFSHVVYVVEEDLPSPAASAKRVCRYTS